METVGELLRAARERKKIPLEEISRVTRIKVAFLKALEKDDFTSFPGELYLRGFLQAFACQVGLDPAEIISRYKSQTEKIREEKARETRPAGKGPTGWLVPASLVLLVLVVGLLYYLLSNSPPKVGPANQGMKAVGLAPEAKALPPAVTSGEPLAEVRPEPEAKPSKVYELALKARELTWLRVQADEEPARELTLKPGEELTLTAIHGFELVVGNAAGLEVVFDGQPLGPLGTRGEVVSLALPEEGS